MREPRKMTLVECGKNAVTAAVLTFTRGFTMSEEVPPGVSICSSFISRTMSRVCWLSRSSWRYRVRAVRVLKTRGALFRLILGRGAITAVESRPLDSIQFREKHSTLHTASKMATCRRLPHGKRGPLPSDIPRLGVHCALSVLSACCLAPVNPCDLKRSVFPCPHVNHNAISSGWAKKRRSDEAATLPWTQSLDHKKEF